MQFYIIIYANYIFGNFQKLLYIFNKFELLLPIELKSIKI